MPLFERDRYQRLDGGGGAARRPPPSSSSFCSSATIVVFVALCLVAAWMMASSNNIAVTVSPENTNASGAKDQDGSVDVDVSQQASDEVPGTPARKNDDVAGGGAQSTPEENGDTGKKDDGTGGDGGGDGGNNNKDGGAGAAQTPDPDSTVGNSTAGGTDAEGDTPASKNRTFSDESGKSEGGEVAKPEDPDKKDEPTAIDDSNNTSTNTTSPSGQDQDEKNTDKNANETGGHDKGEEEAPTSDDKSAAGGQDDNTDDNSNGGQAKNSTRETPTDPSKETVTGGDVDGTMTKNQTSSDDTNCGSTDGGGAQNVKEDGKFAAEKSSDEAASGDKVESTVDGDDGASKNATSSRGGQNQNVAAETVPVSGADNSSGSGSGNITEDSYAMNSTATTYDEEKKAELLPSGQAELLNETASAENTAFPTQASESSDENKNKSKQDNEQAAGSGETETSYTWKLCNTSTGADYIPCLDNESAIKKLKSNKHYEHRERHCPPWDDAPTCLVPLPDGYRQPIPWPYSRDKIWYHNVPHTMLASYKGHQNWVKVSGEHLTFPGGGTQFKHGARHYIDVIEEALHPEILSWGNRSRVVLDVGCGVASFGGFLFDRDVVTVSFAPKDEHEAQVQFALERGIPAVSAVMGTKRLPFPGNAFDVVHCARCRVPWHIDGGTLLLEVNRLLRPGGLFVWSATPVYRKDPENVDIWHAMAALTKPTCWEMVKKTSDTVDQTAMVVFKKPTSNDCYDARTTNLPPLCEAGDDQDAAWNVTLRPCMHRVPTGASERGSRWPAPWPERLTATPYWLTAGEVLGVYGKPAAADFAADQEHWRKVVGNSYLHGMGIDWDHVRNVMDMRAVYGGFAAALRDMKVWVMNVVTVDSPDTLPVIYERGLFGMYHDWCESFSTYPRTYDLVHADHLFSKIKNRCKLVPVIAEVDRILRPEGKLIVRDDMATVREVQSMARSLHWEVRMTVSKQGEGLLCVRKTMWRPTQVEVRS